MVDRRTNYAKDISAWSREKAGGRVIVYQIRQSFKPGEILPEKANEIDYELEMRFTKDVMHLL